MGLLKRNAADRISFEDYFNHPFMNKAQTTQATEAAIEQPAFMVGNTFTPPKTPSPIQMKTLGDLAAMHSFRTHEQLFVNRFVSFISMQWLQKIQI